MSIVSLPDCFSKYYQIKKVLESPLEDAFIRSWVILAVKLNNLDPPFYISYQKPETNIIVLKVYQESYAAQFANFHEVNALQEGNENGIDGIPILYGTFLMRINKSEFYGIEMEYIDGDPILPDHVQDILKYFISVCKIVQSMNKLNWYHGDLKPEHIYFNSSKQKIAIIDWGSSLNSVYDESEEIDYCVGTRPYLAPEKPEIPLSTQCDIFSLGMILYRWMLDDELNADQENSNLKCYQSKYESIYPSNYYTTIKYFILNKIIPFCELDPVKQNEKYNPKLAQIIKECVDICPEKRISLDELIVKLENLIEEK